MLIGATVAYFYSKHAFEADEFKTMKYSVTTQQLISSDDMHNLVPGKTIPAEISVSNLGEVPLLMRIQYILNGEPMDIENVSVPGWNFGFAVGTQGNNCKYSDEDKAFYNIVVLPAKKVSDSGKETVSTFKHLKSITYTGEGISGNTSEYITEYDREKDKESQNWSATKPATGQKGVKQVCGVTMNMDLKVKVETLQAIDENGEEIDLKWHHDVDYARDWWHKLDYPIDNGS